MNITPDNFEDLVKEVASRETSFDPDGWTAKNPLWGHCAVVSLLAQDYFGGTIWKGKLDGTKYAEGSHFWNKLPNGEEIDFTASQYPDISFRDLDGVKERTREHLLSHLDTKKRYELLKSRFGILTS